MTAVLLDTHAWAWSLYDSSKLSRAATEAMIKARIVWVSPASFHEVAQKVRLGQWPEMATLINDLMPAVNRQNAEIARLDPSICLMAGTFTWQHRDPFDRLLAATALSYNLPIVSADPVFDTLVSRIW